MEFARRVEFTEPLPKLGFGSSSIQALSGQLDVLSGRQAFVADELRRSEAPATFRVSTGVPSTGVGEAPGEAGAVANLFLKKRFMAWRTMWGEVARAGMDFAPFVG